MPRVRRRPKARAGWTGDHVAALCYEFDHFDVFASSSPARNAHPDNRDALLAENVAEKLECWSACCEKAISHWRTRHPTAERPPRWWGESIEDYADRIRPFGFVVDLDDEGEGDE